MRKLKRAIIKEEFVEITGDQLEAILLNQILYWTDKTGPQRYSKWLEEETTREIGDCNIEELEGGWVYKKVDEIKEEIMSTASNSTIARKLNELEKKGYILKRKNPKNKWDKTFQYRINALKLIKDLEDHGYHLQEYNYSEVLRSLQLQKTHIEDSKNHSADSTTHAEDSKTHSADSKTHHDGAIPKSTIEITSEDTSDISNTTFSNLELKTITDFYQEVTERNLKSHLIEEITGITTDADKVMEAIKRASLNNNTTGTPSAQYILSILKNLENEQNENYKYENEADKLEDQGWT